MDNKKLDYIENEIMKIDTDDLIDYIKFDVDYTKLEGFNIILVDYEGNKLEVYYSIKEDKININSEIDSIPLGFFVCNNKYKIINIIKEVLEKEV